MIELVVELFHVHCFRTNHINHRLKAVTGHIQLPCHDEVPQLYRLAEELLEEVHHHQSMTCWILRIEQSYIRFINPQMEVLTQHAIVQQQLHIIGFQHHATMFVRSSRLNEEVLARLLLHQQFPVGCHQVNTTCNAEVLAYKRRFQDGLLPVVRLKEGLYRLLDICRLTLRIFKELVRIEIRTSTELHGFLLEAFDDGGVERALVIIDGVIQRLTREESQQDGLRDSRRCHAVKGIVKRMVAILLEATRNTTDIYEEIRFNHDERRNHPLILFPHLQQIQLHPFLQHILQVAQMGCRVINHQQVICIFLSRGDSNGLFIPFPDNTPDIVVTITLARIGNLVRGRYSCHDVVRHGGMEDRRDEQTQSADIVHQILIRQ